MFSFWPFHKPSRREQFQNTLSQSARDVLEGAEHAWSEIASSTGEAAKNVAKVAASSVASLDKVVEGTTHNAAKNTARTFGQLKARGGDILESTKNIVADQTKSVASAAANVAANAAASGTQSAKKGFDAARESSTRLRETAKNASEHIVDAHENTRKAALKKASQVVATAGSVVHDSSEKIGEEAQIVTQSAQQNLLALLGGIAAAAASARESAQNRADEIVAGAKEISLPSVSVPQISRPHLSIPQFSLPAASQVASQMGEKWQDGKQNVARRARDAASRQTGEPTYDELKVRLQKTDEHDSRLLWLAAGVVAGAILMLLLAPTSGRRSRAALRDKAAKAARGAKTLGQNAKSKTHDLENRAKGKIIERAARHAEDDADDSIIADRVRTALGENEITRNLQRLNVDVADGLVTLRGPIVETELEAQIEAVVRNVKGVRDVRSDLLIADAPEDEQTFVG